MFDFVLFVFGDRHRLNLKTKQQGYWYALQNLGPMKYVIHTGVFVMYSLLQKVTPMTFVYFAYFLIFQPAFLLGKTLGNSIHWKNQKSYYFFFMTRAMLDKNQQENTPNVSERKHSAARVMQQGDVAGIRWLWCKQYINQFIHANKIIFIWLRNTTIVWWFSYLRHMIEV